MSRLPEPSSERWQPLRIGLKNLYRYDDERFVFAGGRLLLRGNNGTGKTRVLALTLPFLLDGETRPARVEPDGDMSRRFEWHLLMDRYHERTGYAWIEFGRLEDGAPRFCTLGCGLRAVEGHQGLRGRWFFVSSARVDDGIALADGSGAPPSRERLKEMLEGRGTVYDTADSYRRAVDDALFGLGQRRYETLTKLLIELRRPQLSRELNEAALSAALTDALTPVEQSVLSDVAEGYQGLERDRDELVAVEAATEAVAAFNAIHRREVSVHARIFADKVRIAHGRYDDAQGTVRDAQEARAEAENNLDAARRRRETAEQNREQAEGAVRALQASPEMRTAERLARLKEDANRARRLADADAAVAAENADEARRFAEDAEEAKSRTLAADNAVSAAVAAARSAGEQFGLVPEEGEEPTRYRRRLTDGLQTRRTAAKKLTQLEQVVLSKQAAFVHAEHRVRDAEELRDASLRSAGEAEERLANARREFSASARSYISSLLECRVDMDAADGEIARWLEEPEGRDPLSGALAAAAPARLRALAEERAAKSHSRDLLVRERSKLSAEADQLRAGVDPEPPGPSHRDGQKRLARPGAPLWRVVDFRKEVSKAARAGYEAALQASGLLDAWLYPDGRLELDADGDFYLDVKNAGKRVGAGLNAVLLPVIDPSDSRASVLTAETVVRVLGAVGTQTDDGACWVTAEGRWRNGPVRGAWTKSAAEFMGAGARSSARQERLRRIQLQIEHLDHETAMLEAGLTELDAAQSRAQQEQDGAPDSEGVRQSWHAARAQAHTLATAREHAATCQTESSARRTELSQAEGERDDFAVDCGLVDWIKRGEELIEAFSVLGARASELDRAIREAVERKDAAEKALKRAGTRQAAADQAATRARENSGVAAALTAELQELEAIQGSAVKELLERLDAVRRKAEAADKERKEASEEEGQARGAIGRAEGEETQARRQLDGLAAERSSCIRSLREIAAEGLLAILGKSFQDAVPPDAADTRILELARALAREVGEIPRDDAAVDRLETEVGEAFQTLHRTLSSSDMRPIGDVRHRLHLVRVPFQGRDRGTAELEALLRDDAAQRRQLLTANERKVIENFLLDEAAGHLHGLLHEAEKWVAAVNRELESRPMSTGMALRFRWKPDAEAPQGTAEARERLLRPSHAWSTADREGLAAFLQGRIAAAREEAPGATWQEQLAIALDYRRWHRFMIERRDHMGRWVRLTKRTHGTGSSGEKAVALTMPQFAAAAAHYHGSPKAPRLILLDEVFVGIDNDMRRHCLGLLAAFDLDVVMTSEREWGCYDTVPALAIYQLASSGDCIATTRYVWNGRQRIREDGTS